MGDGLIKRCFVAFDDLDSVLEFGACDEFRQLILSFQSSPRPGGGDDQLEDYQRAVFEDSAPLVRTVRWRTVAKGVFDVIVSFMAYRSP